MFLEDTEGSQQQQTTQNWLDFSWVQERNLSYLINKILGNMEIDTGTPFLENSK